MWHYNYSSYLMHKAGFKYIDKVYRNGRWQYIYDKSDLRNIASTSVKRPSINRPTIVKPNVGNRPTGRKMHISETVGYKGKAVYKRGEGLNTGPVSGKTSSNAPKKPDSSGSSVRNKLPRQREKHVTTPKSETYTVKKGDTLSGIANKYGTTYQKLAKDNQIKNPDLIYPDQKVEVKAEAKKVYKRGEGLNTGPVGRKQDQPQTQVQTSVSNEQIEQKQNHKSNNFKRAMENKKLEGLGSTKDNIEKIEESKTEDKTKKTTNNYKKANENRKLEGLSAQQNKPKESTEKGSDKSDIQKVLEVVKANRKATNKVASGKSESNSSGSSNSVSSNSKKAVNSAIGNSIYSVANRFKQELMVNGYAEAKRKYASVIKELERQGYTIDKNGNVVKKP